MPCFVCSNRTILCELLRSKPNLSIEKQHGTDRVFCIHFVLCATYAEQSDKMKARQRFQRPHKHWTLNNKNKSDDDDDDNNNNSHTNSHNCQRLCRFIHEEHILHMIVGSANAVSADCGLGDPPCTFHICILLNAEHHTWNRVCYYYFHIYDMIF